MTITLAHPLPADHSPAKPFPAASRTGEGPGVIDSRDLFRGGNTVHIAHAGQCYQLRLTRENKLILTK